jgi:hypothetical protein
MCRSAAAALALGWKRKTKAMSAPLKVFFLRMAHTIVSLFVVVSLIKLIY